MTAVEQDRPTWLTRPCSAWCYEGHVENEHPDDRACWGEDHAVVAAIEPSVHMSDGTWQPEEVRVNIKQGWREVAPRVELGKGDDPRVSLLPDEARALGELLIRLADEAG